MLLWIIKYRLIGSNGEVKLIILIQQEDLALSYSQICFIAAQTFSMVYLVIIKRIINKHVPLIWICYCYGCILQHLYINILLIRKKLKIELSKEKGLSEREILLLFLFVVFMDNGLTTNNFFNAGSFGSYAMDERTYY